MNNQQQDKRMNPNKMNPKKMNPIMTVWKVSKNFGGVKALNECSLKIDRAKITTLIGPNGSGKTTMFNAVSNIIDIDSGNIFLDDIDITRVDDYDIAKSGISRTFQQVRLFKNLTIKDHIEIALSENDEYLLKSFFKSKDKMLKAVKDALKLVGLDKPLDTYGSDLSYGQRKLLDIAIGIAKPHKILMLDEPVAGVNPVLRQQIKNIIKQLRDNGETILLIEHDMDFVMDLADNIYVMDAGHIIAKGTPKQIQNNKKVLEAYLGG
jgi:branched-chain amino acid transport system ATP-binding protein